MKIIDKNTKLIQFGKELLPTEIEGVIYWTDENSDVFENDHIIKEGKIVQISYLLSDDVNFPKIVAQSEQKLENVFIISLDIKMLNDAQDYAIKTKSWNLEAHRKGYIEGFKANPNQYTLQDIEKAIRLTRGIRRYDKKTEQWYEHILPNEEIIEELNSIQLIQVDNEFKIISYE